MRASSAPAVPKAIDRPTAWACTVTNLATLPGLGSLAAGRRVGYAQAAVALTGFGLSLLWMGLFVRDWVSEGSLPLEWRPSLWIGLGGLGVFGLGWLWALTTSLSLLHAARLNERSPSASAAAGPAPPPRLEQNRPDDSSSATPPRL